MKVKLSNVKVNLMKILKSGDLNPRNVKLSGIQNFGYNPNHSEPDFQPEETTSPDENYKPSFIRS